MRWLFATVMIATSKNIPRYLPPPQDEKLHAPWDRFHAAIDQLDKSAKELFEQDLVYDSERIYRDQIELLEGYHMSSDDEEQIQKELLARACTNLSLSALVQRKPQMCIHWASKALRLVALPDKKQKLIYWKAKVCPSMLSCE